MKKILIGVAILAFLILLWVTLFHDRIIVMTYIGNNVKAVQVWFIFMNSEDMKIRAYPMKKVEGRENEFRCSIPRALFGSGDCISWIYLSEKYLGDEPVVFGLTPHFPFTFSQQKI